MHQSDAGILWVAVGSEQPLFLHLSCSVSMRAEKFLCSVNIVRFIESVWDASGVVSGRVHWHV